MNKAMVAAIAIAPLFVSSLIQTSLGMPGPKISVEPPYLQVSPGEKFTVNITIYPEGEEIFGAQYTLFFDNSLLQALSQNQGPFLGGNVMVNEIDNSNGKVNFSEYRIGSSGVTNPGVLATITFNATKPGTSSLNLSEVILSDPYSFEIADVLICDGTCNIGTTPTPTHTPTSTPTPTSESGDSNSGDASVTSTPTSTPASISSPTETPDSTPMQTSTINSVPSPSPSPSPTPTIATSSPTSIVSLPMSGEKENKGQGIPGFEAVFVTAGLLVIASYLIFKKGKIGGKK